ncbi:MAG TPA: ABC transporter substrate-binding protein, partial [Methylomirabilota bacterium]|nr:ABC transporter substrate-binding protein [Methylomirabilota bacterium]
MRRAFRFPAGRSRGDLILLSCLVAIAMAGPGCSRPRTQADLVILNGAEPESLDPAIATGQPDHRIVQALFEGLTRFHPQTAKPEPGLAERWEVLDGGLTYVFHLRTNAVWSTGEPVTADDFVYSWRRLADPKTGADYSGNLYFVKNAEAINTGALTNLAALGAR